MRSRLAVLFAALLVALPWSLALADAPQREGSDAAGRALLASTFAGPSHPVAGTVAVVVLDEDGPFVSELDVTATPAGEMVVGRSRSFAVGREGDNAFLARDGTLLQLGVVVGDEDPVEAILGNYDVRYLGTSQLETGTAKGVDLFDLTGLRRERLWVDDRSGVVVRRETYDLDGVPRRLVAFTELTLVAPTAEGSSPSTTDQMLTAGPVSELAADALATMAKTGWHVPADLPGSFTLSRGFALDNGGGRSSLHLIYSDGLYTISVYEQPGALAEEALTGAVLTAADGARVWRWPGAQPERLVWSAGGMTFTAIADATPDRLLASLAPLPRSHHRSVGERLGRGIARVGSWLNPFA